MGKDETDLVKIVNHFILYARNILLQALWQDILLRYRTKKKIYEKY